MRCDGMNIEIQNPKNSAILNYGKRVGKSLLMTTLL